MLLENTFIVELNSYNKSDLDKDPATVVFVATTLGCEWQYDNRVSSWSGGNTNERARREETQKVKNRWALKLSTFFLHATFSSLKEYINSVHLRTWVIL